MAHDVFVSYSSHDTNIADLVCASLEERGLRCWIAPRDILPGTPWPEAIIKAINSCQVVVLVFSKYANESDMVWREAERAVHKNVPVVPVKIEPVTFSATLEFLLSILHWFEAFPQPIEQYLPHLVDKVHSLLEEPEALTKRGPSDLNKIAPTAPPILASPSSRTADSIQHGQRPPYRVQDLLFVDGRERFAEHCTESYPHHRVDTVRALAEACIQMSSQNPDYAIDLACRFANKLKLIDDPFLREIVDLLKEGLPDEPVHLQGLLMLTVDNLFEIRGYAALIHGIRLTEKDYAQALDHLRSISPIPKRCALFAYAFGQCARKLSRMYEAETHLNIALNLVEGWRKETCTCGAECSKHGLLVEIHRGLGVLCRKQEEWEEAKAHFERGEKTILRQPDVHETTADLLYGYGYLMLEWAWRERRHSTNESTDYLQLDESRLSEALRLFRRSLHQRRYWSAPACRLAMVLQLQGRTGDNEVISAYVDAERYATQETGVESSLTAANCRFAVLLLSSRMKVRARSSVSFDPEQMFRDLAATFHGFPVPHSVVQCHALDNEMITGTLNLPGNSWIDHVNQLLQEAAVDWTLNNVDQQRKALKRFHEQRGISARE